MCAFVWVQKCSSNQNPPFSISPLLTQSHAGSKDNLSLLVLPLSDMPPRETGGQSWQQAPQSAGPFHGASNIFSIQVVCREQQQSLHAQGQSGHVESKALIIITIHPER